MTRSWQMTMKWSARRASRITKQLRSRDLRKADPRSLLVELIGASLSATESGSVLVVVLPARPLIRPAIKNYFVEPQDNKRTDIEYFLGAQFARQGEWRAVTATLQPFNSSIARVQLDLSGSPKITITGGDAGRVTIPSIG